MSDIHGPFQDDRSVNLALDIFEDQGIDCLILNGDILDFYTINAYGPKHPDVQETLESELFWGLEFLTNLRKRFKKTEIIFNAGNHEWRLDRYVIQHCPAFYNIVRLEKQLQLKELNIEYVPYNERIQLGSSDLFVQHSPPSYSENAANTSLRKKIDQDHIWGCTHRPDSVFKTGSSGKVYSSYMLGWHGDKGEFNRLQNDMPQNRRVFHFTKNHETWGRSIALASVVGRTHHVNHIIFKEYSALVGNIYYEN